MSDEIHPADAARFARIAAECEERKKHLIPTKKTADEKARERLAELLGAESRSFDDLIAAAERMVMGYSRPAYQKVVVPECVEPPRMPPGCDGDMFGWLRKPDKSKPSDPDVGHPAFSTLRAPRSCDDCENLATAVVALAEENTELAEKLTAAKSLAYKYFDCAKCDAMAVRVEGLACENEKLIEDNEILRKAISVLAERIGE